MADLLEYVQWRGDLPFSAVPLNEVDALIFSQLSYLDFTGCVDSSFKKHTPLSVAAIAFKNSSDYKKKADPGIFINSKTTDLLSAAGKSVRYGNVQLCGFVNVVDTVQQEQFCALTFLPAKREIFVAFRGTDDTIIGWKEDFNMAFLDTIPAQHDACAYLEDVASRFSGVIRVGGHSKGGNLAVFAAAFIPYRYRKRIVAIYNFDGPGLNTAVLKTSGYTAVAGVLHSFFPRFSVVGMLFEHPEHFTVVESGQSGIMQHDPFSWFVLPSSFAVAPEFEKASRYLDKTINGWFLSLSREQREQLVETLFLLLQATEARTNSELTDNWLKNSAAVIRALVGLDSQTRKKALWIVGLLFKRAAKDLPNINKISEIERK